MTPQLDQSTHEHDTPAVGDEPHPHAQSPEPTDGSIELVEHIRARLAQHEEEAARSHRELAVELARQEALWSAREAERQRRERFVGFEATRTGYDELAKAAASAYAELYTISCRAATVFKEAVRAEQARRAAIPELESAWSRLHELEEETAQPAIAAIEDFHFGPHDPRHGISLTGFLVYPETRRELARLRAFDLAAGAGDSRGRPAPPAATSSADPAPARSAGPDPAPPDLARPEGPARPDPVRSDLAQTDPMELLFHRVQAKRELDDDVQRLPAH
jgi:hypothetical protein